MASKLKQLYANWDFAPAWAKWHTVDMHGATWFEYEPIADKLGDWCVGESWDDMGQWDSAGDVDIPLGIDWRTLKQRRPDAHAAGQEGVWRSVNKKAAPPRRTVYGFFVRAG